MSSSDGSGANAQDVHDGDRLTLGTLVEQLGADILQVVAAPGGLDVAITKPTMHDPMDRLITEPGGLVLAVGVSPDDAELLVLMADAAEQHAAAVVVKGRTEMPGGAVCTAEQDDIALIVVPPQMDWGQLHALMRSAFASAGMPTEASPGGVALGDLFALANAIAAMVGGAVSIEDPQSRVLAYSSLDVPLDEPRRETILGRRVPRGWIDWLKEQGVFRALWSGADVVRVPGRAIMGETPLRPRLAVSVWAGSEILGSIWVSQADDPFTDDDVAALQQSARIAALHLVRHRAGDGLERKMRADLLRAVLEGSGSVDVLAGQLGFEPKASYCVVAFELQTGGDAEVALQQERTLQLIGLYNEAMRHRAVTAVVGQQIYTLIPLDEGGPLGGVRRLVDSVVERGRTVLSMPLTVGIGSAVDHLRDAPRSREHADQVLRVLAGETNGQAVATIDDVRSQALLLEFRDLVENRPQFLEGKLQILIEHDEEKSSDYVATLHAYLRHFGDVPTAADALSVHANTFRYRLRRLCEVADLDLDDPDQRLVIEIQLLLL